MVLSAAFLSIAFTSFPYLLMGFGVLWPNLLGQALLPAALATFVGLFRALGKPPYAVADRVRSALLFVAVLPGLVMAHPNAFVSLMFFCGLVLLGRASPGASHPVLAATAGDPRRHARSARRRGRWIGRRAARLDVPHGAAGPEQGVHSAWGDLLTFAPRRTLPLPVLAAIVGVGLIVILVRHRGARWVVPALPVRHAGSLLVQRRRRLTEVTRWFTWPWYNNAVRLHTVAILPAVIAARGAARAGCLSRLVPRLGPPAAPGPSWRGPPPARGPLLTPRPRTERSCTATSIPATSLSWASGTELRALHELGEERAARRRGGGQPVERRHLPLRRQRDRMLIPTEKTNSPGDRSCSPAPRPRGHRPGRSAAASTACPMP